MSVVCDCRAEDIKKLNLQVSVMRKELKNLRQMLDTAVRTHRKHMLSLQSAVSKLGCGEAQPPAQPSPASPQAALEQGSIQTVPIGYIRSCFSVKNATPRQPTICGPSRAELRIQRSVFANPEHALMGLEQYSHVWIIFLFHKNGHLSYKAKVKPPRLNGQRVGVYSTRSPHRPNVVGLTLAKLDKIIGDTIFLSDIDMIAGTPVLDIKPYIPEYDYPGNRIINNFEPQDLNMDQPVEMSVPHKAPAMPSPAKDVESNLQDARSEGLHSGIQVKKEKSLLDNPVTDLSSHDLFHALEEVKTYVTQSGLPQLSCESKCRVSDQQKTETQNLTMEHPSYGEEAYSTISDWIRHPPVTSLHVRFTPHAEKGLAAFFPSHMQEPCKSERPTFKFLRSLEEASAAIRGVLSADPRSVYRRKRCKDRLFFFTLDTAHVTCWFGQDFVEVLQVQPVEHQIALE